ncbi:MAG: histidine phosphatase family protein [Deltaproteobacteria bacterium]|nr:histidine phosphatase family protein [Deltaproteobacteria bacterium]MBW2416427.1 histidine phosphatase family protein [Deltaproteobacteria bacterium]
MPETRLVLIRHGESHATVDGVVGGHESCRGLTDRGRRQAEALRDRLKASPEFAPDVLLTSILPRAIETAEIVAPAFGDLEAARDCDLCELHPGECDGLVWADYRERYGFDMRAEPERPMSPGGESLASFQARVEARLERVLREHAGQTVVIVAHGGVVSAVSLSLMAHGMHLPRPFRMRTENTSITEWLHDADVQRGDPAWLLVRYNDAAHLGRGPRRA